MAKAAGRTLETPAVQTLYAWDMFYDAFRAVKD